MIKNKSGFAVLESLLILIIIVIIGGTGYYVWHSKGQTDKNLNNAASATLSATVKKRAAAPSSSSPATTKAQTPSTAKSADGKVQVTLPDGWKVAERVDGGQKCGFVYTDPSTCVSEISFQDSSNNLNSYIKIFKSSESASQWYTTVNGDCSDSKDISVNGHPGFTCTSNTDVSTIEYVVSNGAYVAYFYGPDTSIENTFVRTILFL